MEQKIKRLKLMFDSKIHSTNLNRQKTKTNVLDPEKKYIKPFLQKL